MEFSYEKNPTEVELKIFDQPTKL